MAVQKSKKSRSCRGMRRAHDSLGKATLSIDVGTGETHLRHHVSPKDFYKGKEVIKQKAAFEPERHECSVHETGAQRISQSPRSG